MPTDVGPALLDGVIAQQMTDLRAGAESPKPSCPGWLWRSLRRHGSAWKVSGTNFRYQRGSSWAHGGFAHTMFSTIVIPSSKQAIWSERDHYSSSAVGTFGNASSDHPGGVNSLFADGSVRFRKDSINQDTWWRLGTKDAGEVVSADSF
jgi:prepilin-type processing-associated H-X9-DG protein